METIEDIKTAYLQADCLKTAAEVDVVIGEMAKAITARIGESNPVILCVMKGGLMVCSKLLERMQFPLEIDYLHATRYQNDTVGMATIDWHAKPQTDLTDRTVLLIDDILDEGATLQAILQDPLLATASEVLTAVLIDKEHDRKTDPSYKADFTGMTIEDRYLFGYGMDYKGYLRNALGIFAIK